MSDLQDLLSSTEPAPDPAGGQLAVLVRCYTDASRTRWSQHELVLLADWSAQVPHDLEAERVLTALGGFCSCLELVEAAVPAARSYVRRQLRQVLPHLARGRSRSGAWRLAERVDGCCAGGVIYRSAQEAAEHARSTRHLAALHGARATGVRAVGAAVLAAHGAADPVPPPRSAARELAPCLLEPSGAAALWEAGLPPELVLEVHRRVAVQGRPLPTGFYLGALTRRPDLRWIADTAAGAPERELHEWLAWSESDEDRRDPTRRAGWLAAGVSQRDIPVLDAAGYTPADVRGLSTGLGRSGATAGAVLARWVAVGAAPTVSDLLRLAGLAAPAYAQVTVGAVDRLAAEAAVLPLRLSREELATALAVCGSAARAASALAELESADPQALTRWVQARDAATDHPPARRTGATTRA